MKKETGTLANVLCDNKVRRPASVPVIMKQVFDTMSEATGVDFSEIMKANTYDAKVTKNINLSSPNGAEVQVKMNPNPSSDAASDAAQ